MALAEAALEEARPAHQAMSGGEQRHVRNGDGSNENAADRRAQAARDHRERHGEQPKSDEPLEFERLVPRSNACRDEGAEAQHGCDVEGVRTDDDPDRDRVLVLDERRDRRRDLGRVGCERREQAEQGLRQAELEADVVEPPREDRRCDEHHADRDEEERYGGCRRHRLTPTSLPGTPLRTLAQEAQVLGSGGASSDSISDSAISALSLPARPGTGPPPA